MRSRPAYIHKPGRYKNAGKQQQCFIQGLPQVGPHLAAGLLDHFGNIENIILADVDDLQKVPGIGKGRSLKISAFSRNTNGLAKRGPSANIF